MNGDSPTLEEVLRELAQERSAHRSTLQKAEQQRRVTEALEEAVRSRDDVLSIVAHDLRNPLNVISLAANTLLLSLPDASARRSMERIVRSVQRADRMIADLLTINTIETGRFAIDTKPVQTAELVLAALESQ